MSESDNMIENGSAPKKSTWPLWVALLLLIGLLAGSFVIWQNLNSTIAQQQQLLATQQLQLSHLQESSQDQQKQLADISKQTQTLHGLTQQAIELGQRRQKSWLVAEADYLMRMANRRLQISRDINGAIAALQGADSGLHEAGDLALLPVRQQLAKDLAALKSLRTVDVDGMALALDEMAKQVAVLPFKTFSSDAAEPTIEASQTAAKESSWTDQIINRIMTLGDITIREHSDNTRNNLQSREQSRYVLLSHLLSARLAVLRYDTRQFAHDLNSSQQTLQQYFETRDPQVTHMLKDLAAWSSIELNPELPDISVAWQVLQKNRHKLTEAK